MRNIVAHEYAAIDHNIVCNALTDNFPTEAAGVGGQRTLDT